MRLKLLRQLVLDISDVKFDLLVEALHGRIESLKHYIDHLSLHALLKHLFSFSLFRSKLFWCLVSDGSCGIFMVDFDPQFYRHSRVCIHQLSV